MTPDDLTGYATISDPQMHPDGTRVAFVVSRMNIDEDRYDREIWLWDGASARAFTAGPRDLRPRWSPDGTQLAFLRIAAAGGKIGQVHVIPTGGGEPRRLTDFDLGASEAEWSPDGTRLAVVGKTWTDEWAGLDEEERERRPSRVTRAGWRFDNETWWHDRRTHLYLVDPAGGGDPEVLTPGDFNDKLIAWHPAGDRIGFISARHDRRGIDPGNQVWEVPAAGGEATPVTEVGNFAWTGYAPDGDLHIYGVVDPWGWPDVGKVFERGDDGTLTDRTGHLDRDPIPLAPTVVPAGPQWVDGGFVTALEDDGRVRVIRIADDGSTVDLIDGNRAVTGVTPRSDGSAMAFVAVAPADPGELYWWEDGEERVLTDLNAAFRESAGLIEPEPFSFESDGVEIHGWVYLPPGDDQVPLLLNIHGGPASQYGLQFFDEFQVYAGAGYGVVACNPRGSSGRGRDYVQAVVGAWQKDFPLDMGDFQACVAAAGSLFPRLDQDRMGVMGGSYGGLATTRLISLDQRFASAIVERALTTFTSFTGTSDIGTYFGPMYLGASYFEDYEAFRDASPLMHVRSITTPTLVLHSEEDYRCPIEQGEQLYTLLQMLGVPSEMVRFPGESHEMSRSGKPRHRKERFEIILEWHGRYLSVPN